jgi:hypothetical protein
MLNPLTRKVSQLTIYRSSLGSPLPAKRWDGVSVRASFSQMPSFHPLKRSKAHFLQLLSSQLLLLLALFNFILLVAVTSLNIWHRDTRLPMISTNNNLRFIPTASLFDLTRNYNQMQQWNNEGILFHTVALGDGVGLSSLALHYNLSLGTLLTVNNLKSLDASMGREQVRVPIINGLQVTVPVRRSVAQIAKKYNISEDKLRGANHLTHDTVAPKSTLFIPDALLSAGKIKRMIGDAFIYPVFGTLTQEFGWQEDAITGLLHSYNGISFTTEAGAKVVASKTGRVSTLGVHPFYGLYLIIDHGSGVQTMYGRLEKSQVKLGQSVAQGELLGQVKASGYRGKGLFYFSIIKQGLPENPLTLLR